MAELITLGYEGTDITQFMRVLKAKQVNTLVDVRELPVSRKKGFSKRGLAQACSDNCINYEHWQELGCPKDIREDYKSDRNWERYSIRYREHLPKIAHNIRMLADRATSELICLVCFEADPSFCHRSHIAEAVKETNHGPIIIRHLTKAGLTVTPQLLSI